MGATVTCIKLLLSLFNVVFLVSGLVMLALGTWMKVRGYGSIPMYMDLTDVYYPAAPYILIAVGCVIIVVVLLGCICTVCGIPSLLYLYSVFLILIFLVELATAISAFVYKAKLYDGLKSGLHQAMNNYNTTNKKRAVPVDGIQRALKCCGSASYEDWYEIDWSGTGVVDAVPRSCCNQTAVTAEHQCDGTAVDDIYTTGCFSKLSSFLDSNFLVIGSIAVGFSFLQLLGAVLACCLAKNINRAKYEEVAG